MDIRAYGVAEMSGDELRHVTGGESLWYYIGYGIGWVAGAFTSFAADPENGQWMNTA